MLLLLLLLWLLLGLLLLLLHGSLRPVLPLLPGLRLTSPSALLWGRPLLLQPTRERRCPCVELRALLLLLLLRQLGWHLPGLGRLLLCLRLQVSLRLDMVYVVGFVKPKFGGFLLCRTYLHHLRVPCLEEEGSLALLQHCGERVASLHWEHHGLHLLHGRHAEGLLHHPDVRQLRHIHRGDLLLLLLLLLSLLALGLACVRVAPVVPRTTEGLCLLLHSGHPLEVHPDVRSGP